jgi:hypothetical protein
MRRYPAACVAILLFVALPASQAQQAPPPPTSAPPVTAPTSPGLDAQSAAVLKACSATIGGTASAQITDTVTQATVSDPSNTSATPSTLTIRTKGANMVRWDTIVNGTTYSSISALGQQKNQNPKNGAWIMGPSANANHERILHNPALMIGQEIARNDLSAIYVAQETLDGRSVHHILLARVSQHNDLFDAQLTKNSEIELFIDSETNLITKIAYMHISETDMRMGIPVEVFYDSYKQVNGMMIPFAQRMVIYNQVKSVTQITSVQVNTGLADSIFQGVN